MTHNLSVSARRDLNICIYGMALMMLAAAPVARAGLIGYYPLDGNLQDASGNGNNGTAGSDAPTFAPGATGHSGDYGAAFTGNDSSQFFTVPININASVTSQVTFGGWIEATATDPIRGFISNDRGSYGRTLDVDYRSGSTGYSAFAGGKGVIGGVAPTAGQFDFVAVTYDATANGGMGGVALYVNEMPAITSTGLPPDGDSLLTIGRNPHYDRPFGGVIDDVFVFNNTLNAAQIADIRQNGVWLLPGDANRDGTVGFADLVALARHYGQSGAVWADGDFDYDGKVDFADLVILARHYGQSAPAGQLAAPGGSPSSALVPEPALTALLSFAAAALLCRRSIRSHPFSFELPASALG